VKRKIILHCNIIKVKIMSERLLEPVAVNVPDCPCGTPMAFERIQESHEDMKIEVFHCPDCGHEIRLTLWTSAADNH
jgi:hypothetical protein